MNKRLAAALALTTLFTLNIIALTSFTVSANISVGIKKGDWIDYQVTTKGSPPPEHDAKWARMYVMNVQGDAVNLNITTLFNNGTYLYENVTLNLKTGQLGDDFFIPANLTKGDTFFDAHAGNITITGIYQKMYANSERIVVSGSTTQTKFYWDKQTGVLVQAYSTYPNDNFTMATIVSETNMWQPQTSELETIAISIIAFATTATAIAIGIALFLIKRKKSS